MATASIGNTNKVELVMDYFLATGYILTLGSAPDDPQ